MQTTLIRPRARGHRGKVAVRRSFPDFLVLEPRQLLSISAVPDLFGVIEDTPLHVPAAGILANDQANPSGTLSVTTHTSPAHGTLTLNPDGSFDYVPSAGYVGTDTFTYTMTDGSGSFASAPVNLSVAPLIASASVFAGPRLASVDSTQSALLDALLGGLAGTSLGLNAVDWQGLAQADISGEDLANALQLALGASSPGSAMTTDATLAQVFSATATVLQVQGGTAAAATLNNLAATLSGLTGSIRLGDLVQADAGDGALATSGLNVLDLVTGTLELYNAQNVATTPTPVILSGAALGLDPLIGSVSLSAQAVEPPVITTGPAGTQFHSAAIRLKLDVNLVNADLALGSLTSLLDTALLGVATATVSGSLGQFSVYTEVASGQGTIASVDALANAVTLQATPGLTDLYLGTLPDSVFFDRTHALSPADVGYGTVGTLGITLKSPLLGTTLADVSTSIEAKSTAAGDAPSSTSELFLGPFPQSQTVSTSATFLSDLVTSLVNNLSVQLSGSLGALLDPLVNGTILPAVTTAVDDGVAPLLSPILSGLVDPSLTALGTGLGELILTVSGIGLMTPPIANSDFAETLLDTPVIVPVLANDASAPGDTLSVTGVTQPSHGATSVNPDGTITYTPAPGYVGTDTFNDTVTNGVGLSSTSTVTVDVVPPPPVAVDDSFSTTSGTPLIVAAPGVLSNDSDAGGRTLTSSLVTSPAHGTLTLGADGSFSYIPNAGYVGTDSFSYRPVAGTDVGNTAVVSLSILPAVIPPTANNDAYSATADTVLTVVAPGVLANDSDPNGQPLSSSLVSGPNHGVLVLNGDGSFAYTPSPGYTGPDAFLYAATNGTLTSAPATVTLNIVAPAPPLVNDDSYTVVSGATLSIVGPGVLANDANPGGGPMTATAISFPSHGALSFNSDGSFSYTPDPGYVGPDSFRYQASNGLSQSTGALVSINVTSPADLSPVAADDVFVLPAGSSLMVPPPGVLSNDSDPSGSPLTAIRVSGPAHGSLNLLPDGSFSYVPDPGFSGFDTFTYRDSNGTLTGNAATVTLNVLPAPPVSADDTYSLTENQSVSVSAPGVLGNDLDPGGLSLSANVLAGPSHGSLAFHPDGSFTYIPAAGFFGNDSFTYRAGNGVYTGNTATVTLDIRPAPPVMNDSLYTLIENSVLDVAAPGLLQVATAPSGQPLISLLDTSPTHGALNLNPDGSFTYAPDANFTGTDQFLVRVSDGDQVSNAATITLIVSPSAASPVGVPDTYTLTAGTTLSVAGPGVLGNDSAPGGGLLAASLESGPSHGALKLMSDGSFSYAPTAGFIGIDQFRYRATNGTGVSAPTFVSLVVLPPIPVPVANPDQYTVETGTILSPPASGVLGNDTDPGLLPLSAVLDAEPSHGSLRLNADGSFTYTPQPNYVGSDSFSYRAEDGNSVSDPTIVELSVVASTPTLVATPVSLSATGCVTLDGVTVLRFTGGAQDPSSFVASIDWGDGNTSAGRVVGAGGQYQVLGAHTYHTTGTFRISVAVTGPSSSALTASSKIEVVHPSITATLGSSSVTVVGGTTANPSPTFLGHAPPGDTIRLYAQRVGQSELVLVAQTTADAQGAFHVTSRPLNDGSYRFRVTAIAACGCADCEASALADPGILTIATTPPVVTRAVLYPSRGTIDVTFQSGTPLDPATLSDTSNYHVSRPYSPKRRLVSVTGALPHQVGPGGLQTVTLILNGGRRVTHARFVLRVRSGGVADLAGNALDGEFHGKFPSGDGKAGGDFFVRLDFNSYKVLRPKPVPFIAILEQSGRNLSSGSPIASRGSGVLNAGEKHTAKELVEESNARGSGRRLAALELAVEGQGVRDGARHANAHLTTWELKHDRNFRRPSR